MTNQYLVTVYPRNNFDCTVADWNRVQHLLLSHLPQFRATSTFDMSDTVRFPVVQSDTATQAELTLANQLVAQYFNLA